ncbi:E3 ubiquitin/ISG15 ligase TRIM25-like [Carassius auratus]|uniref:E3 ubiquitin/ISG15 ligase TRIM25-like n=1 Tax=Carassius auratus TaxID=7957 RepID=A0A6P6RGC6_CARAU|nr:E3 ubiquitin/ISG15 ligase TRIM25-like [Carassius auratus]
MAEARFSHDQFSCSVCLDLLKDPVTIPCGHSYCMSCIKQCWNQEDEKRVYSCPQCRQTFRPRPALGKNTMLAEVVEQLKKTDLQTAVPAGPRDVKCDVCTGRKQKAVKSCLVCLNSFCQNHLEQHENLFRGKRHDLMDATKYLQKMICSKHKKLLDIFCCSDQRCICMLCMVDKHKNHDTVSTAAERKEKQKHLGDTQRKYHKQIKKRKKKIRELKEAVEIHKQSAQTAVEDSERIFGKLISSIKRRRSEVTQMIRDQEKTVVSRAEALIKQLEKEIDQMRSINDELEQLSQTHNDIHFLQSYLSLPVPPGSPDVPKINERSFDKVGKSVSRLRQELEDFCTKEIEKLSGQVRCIQIIPPPGHVIKKKLFLVTIKQQILEEEQWDSEG